MEQILLNFNDVDSALKIFVTQNLAPINALTLNEKKLTTGFAQKRLAHFNTGRYCAKMALCKIEIGDYEILKGEDGEPIWPMGFVGSISHTEGLYGAVVAKKADIIAIGLDIEQIGKIKPNMWDMLFTPKEQEYLSTKNEQECAIYATLFFSMKESFYKMQFPITKHKLWHTDVQLTEQNGNFKIVVLKEFEGKELLPKSNLRYTAISSKYIITLCFSS